MYTRILVVISQQPWVDIPVEYAIALATETGAELSILAVLMPPLLAGIPDATGSCAMVLESVVAHSRAVLAEAGALAEQAGVAYTLHLRWGNTADTILHTAAAEACDLIIIGSYAGTWQDRRLQRYVITKVTAGARQPLLIVTAPPAEAYCGTRWSRLLVVRDGSPGGEAAMHYALTLAQEVGLDVCLLHVNGLWQHGDLSSCCGMYGVPDMLALAEARTAATEVSHDVVYAAGDPTLAIVETATARECDVILLGAVPRGWKRLVYRPLVREVLAHTTRPVLLVNPLVACAYEWI